ncbi:MAG: M56 family metallopeptidase [Gammaproteobacteria bacterium]
MSILDSLLSTPLAYHLGWTLVHFLWQGALVGAIYACLRFVLQDSAPESRYWLSLGTLALLATLPVLTFIHLLASPLAVPGIAGVAHTVHSLSTTPEVSPFAVLRELLHPIVPWTVPAWCAGVALMALRSLAAWHKIRSLTRSGAEEAPDQWQDKLVDLAMRVGVHVRVRLMVTAKVAVPCVVGWMKPIILIPPAALAGLTTLQLEMVLAHELAHIRRHDYLVNLLQLLVETLLFYHPVVRWISQDARRERELCCDDSAVCACGDALHYAHALTDLADIRAADMRLAVGLNGGDLALRVERLIAPHHVYEGAPRLPTLMLATGVFLSGLLMLVSARNMPMPLAQLQAFSLYQPSIDVNSTWRERSRTALTPTSIPPTIRQDSGSETLESTQLVADDALSLLDEPMAPLPVRDNPPAVVEVHKVNIVTADGISEATDNSTQAQSAVEHLRIISINPLQETVPAQGSPHHQYCTPITGSRVCS